MIDGPTRDEVDEAIRTAETAGGTCKYPEWRTPEHVLAAAVLVLRRDLEAAERRLKHAEATIARVRELPAKWRAHDGRDYETHLDADELEQACQPLAAADAPGSSPPRKIR